MAHVDDPKAVDKGNENILPMPEQIQRWLHDGITLEQIQRWLDDPIDDYFDDDFWVIPDEIIGMENRPGDAGFEHIEDQIYLRFDRRERIGREYEDREKLDPSAYSDELRALLDRLPTLTHEQIWQVRALPVSDGEPDPAAVEIKAAAAALSPDEWWVWHKARSRPTAEDIAEAEAFERACENDDPKLVAYDVLADEQEAAENELERKQRAERRAAAPADRRDLQTQHTKERRALAESFVKQYRDFCKLVDAGGAAADAAIAGMRSRRDALDQASWERAEALLDAMRSPDWKKKFDDMDARFADKFGWGTKAPAEPASASDNPAEHGIAAEPETASGGATAKTAATWESVTYKPSPSRRARPSIMSRLQQDPIRRRSVGRSRPVPTIPAS
jgi:hypothetical protein